MPRSRAKACQVWARWCFEDARKAIVERRYDEGIERLSNLLAYSPELAGARVKQLELDALWLRFLDHLCDAHGLDGFVVTSRTPITVRWPRFDYACEVILCLREAGFLPGGPQPDAPSMAEARLRRFNSFFGLAPDDRSVLMWKTDPFWRLPPPDDQTSITDTRQWQVKEAHGEARGMIDTVAHVLDEMVGRPSQAKNKMNLDERGKSRLRAILNLKRCDVARWDKWIAAQRRVLARYCERPCAALLPDGENDPFARLLPHQVDGPFAGSPALSALDAPHAGLHGRAQGPYHASPGVPALPAELADL